MNKKDFGYNTDCCCLTDREINQILMKENQALKDRWNKLKSIIEKDMDDNQKEYDESFISAFQNYSAAENWVLDRMEELEKGGEKCQKK